MHPLCFQCQDKEMKMRQNPDAFFLLPEDHLSTCRKCGFLPTYCEKEDAQKDGCIFCPSKDIKRGGPFARKLPDDLLEDQIIFWSCIQCQRRWLKIYSWPSLNIFLLSPRESGETEDFRLGRWTICFDDSKTEKPPRTIYITPKRLGLSSDEEWIRKELLDRIAYVLEHKTQENGKWERRNRNQNKAV